MDSRVIEAGDEQPEDGTPEDVAVLYSWAKVRGAKYRDFSASRREYRAQARYRAAVGLRNRELEAQAAAEAAAEAAERDGAIAEAGGQRVEAARRAEAAARAAEVARSEEREIAEAHASAQRQAMRYAEMEARGRELEDTQGTAVTGDPYTAGAEMGESNGGDGSNESGEGPQEEIVERQPVLALSLRESVPLWLAKGYRPDDGAERVNGVVALGPVVADGDDREEIAAAAAHGESDARIGEEHVTLGQALKMVRDRAAVGRGGSEQAGEDEGAGPAWLSRSQAGSQMRTRVTGAISQTHGGETLQDSRERVAARWFALRGVFEHAGPELPAMQPIRTGEARMPVVAVFSLAGGVGKTSLVATLGRALSSQGERVVLTDTTSHVLLPFYFGASELRPGVVRTFSPPEGSTDEPISLVSYELEGRREDAAQQEALAEEILRNSVGHHRVVLDVSSGSSWLIRRMAGLQPTVLVPMAPDMNSVISLLAVERVFRGMVDGDGRQLLPFYLLNQFDASLPLHLDVREVFRRQLGDRLVRFAIRRSPAVSEALAEGMTVVDYAPDAPVSQDYRDVASWLRSVSPPATAGLGAQRWSEQMRAER
jgi:cellulose synthase operon protein YhjQ